MTVAKVRSLVPVRFEGGPLDGTSKSISTTTPGQPPMYYAHETPDEVTRNGRLQGVYRNRAGTHTMVWGKAPSMSVSTLRPSK